MDIKKIGLGLVLAASFGLMACGDDSSSGAGGDDTISCKVIDEDNAIGYEMSTYGIVLSYTSTFNKDGSVTTHMKEVYNSSYSNSVIEMACQEAKEESDREDYDFFKCENGVIEYQYTEKDADVDDNDKALIKYYAEYECAALTGEDMPEGPSFDSEDNDNDDSDNESPADEDDDSVGPQESYSYTCDISEDSDKWVITYNSGDAVTETVYTFEGNSMVTDIKVTSPVSDCSMYESAKPSNGATYSCKDGILTMIHASEKTEVIDKTLQYKIIKANCAK